MKITKEYRNDINRSIVSFYKNSAGGLLAYAGYLGFGTESIVLGSFKVDIEFNDVDDSCIDVLRKLNSKRDLFIFRLFLIKVQFEDVYDYQDGKDIYRQVFHVNFLKFVDENKNKLSPSEIIIAYFDCFHLDKLKRRFLFNIFNKFISGLKSKWVQSDWFMGQYSNAKINSLRDYAKEKLNYDLDNLDLEGVAIFFDWMNCFNNKEYVAYHFSKIKTLFNNRKHREKTSKIQVNLQLSSKAKNEIGRLKKQFGVKTYSEAVEIILMNMSVSGADMYILNQIVAKKKALLELQLAGAVLQSQQTQLSSTYEIAQAVGIQALPEARIVDVNGGAPVSDEASQADDGAHRTVPTRIGAEKEGSLPASNIAKNVDVGVSQNAVPQSAIRAQGLKSFTSEATYHREEVSNLAKNFAYGDSDSYFKTKEKTSISEIEAHLYGAGQMESRIVEINQAPSSEEPLRDERKG